MKGQDEIFKILQDLCSRMSIIVISHDLSSILRYATKIIYINKTATLHDVPNIGVLENSSSEHFCEIDLFYQLTNAQATNNKA